MSHAILHNVNALRLLVLQLQHCPSINLKVPVHRASIPNNPTTKATPIALSFPMSTVIGAELAAPADGLLGVAVDGLIAVPAATDDPAAVPAMVVVVVAAVVLSGPVKKKLPATGLPNPL